MLHSPRECLQKDIHHLLRHKAATTYYTLRQNTYDKRRI